MPLLLDSTYCDLKMKHCDVTVDDRDRAMNHCDRKVNDSEGTVGHCDCAMHHCDEI